MARPFRKITKSMLSEHGKMRVLRSKNMQDDGSIIDKAGYDKYIDDVSNIQVGVAHARPKNQSSPAPRNEGNKTPGNTQTACGGSSTTQQQAIFQLHFAQTLP